MDEAAFRQARDEINRLPCVFTRALLAKEAVCALAVRHAIGERETLACRDPLARAACAALYGLLRQNSAFALHLRDTARILPHAMTMKIECGGLKGLQALFDAEAPAPDVHKLVRQAIEAYGELGALPFSRIVQGVAAWQGRRRRGKQT